MPQSYLTLDEARERVQDLAYSDVYMAVGDIELGVGRTHDSLPNYTVQAEGREMTFSDAAVPSYLKLIGVPPKLVTDCLDDLDLLDRLIDHGRRKRKDQRVRLILDGSSQIRYIKDGSSLGLTLQDVWKVVETLEDIQGVQEVSARESDFSLRLVSTVTASPVRDVGDVSHCGVYVGVNGSVEVTPYVYRLVCTNGMQRYDDVVTMRPEASPTKDDYLAKLRESMTFALTASRQALTKFVRSDETLVDDPREYLLKLFKIAELPDSHRIAMLERVQEEAPRGSVYELTNLVTRYAKEFFERPKLRDRFERFGADVCESAFGARCKSCNSTIC